MSTEAPRPREVKLDTEYTHTPSGGRYRTIELLPDATGYESTGKVGESVRYTQLDKGEKYPAGTVWVRSTKDFLGTTTVEGREVPIFEEIPQEPPGSREEWHSRARGV
jgi:hypothetical protein